MSEFRGCYRLRENRAKADLRALWNSTKGEYRRQPESGPEGIEDDENQKDEDENGDEDSLGGGERGDAIDDSDTEDTESDSAAKKDNVEVSSPDSASSTLLRSASPAPVTSSSHPENPSSGPKPQGTDAAKKRRRPKTSFDATPASNIISG